MKQRNFHDYPMLRINEMPVVEAHIVPSTRRWAASASRACRRWRRRCANAIFAVTGKRMRRLPIRARPEEGVAERRRPLGSALQELPR